MHIYFKQAHAGNYRPAERRAGDIRYLVIHYTANDGDTAKNNADYFARSEVSASAHYFADESEIWQSVRDSDIAWHCGTRGAYFHPYCRNANSLGIELCSVKQNGRFAFRPETVQNAARLAKMLMEKYAVPPENVLRHYDVTHKTCPAPFVENAGAWQAFLQLLKEDNMTENEVKKLINASRTVYHTVHDVPAWGRGTVEKLLRRGFLTGAGDSLALSEDLLRALVINDRAGLYGA